MHTRNLHGTGALRAGDVVTRLEEAGASLLALPNKGPSTRLVQSGLEWIRDAGVQATEPRARLRPAAPDAAAISRMDEALQWIVLIPVEKFVLRRIVGARSLIDPMNGRHLYSWRRIALTVGADHKAVQRWHAMGLAIIVDQLRRMAAGLPVIPPGPAVPQRATVTLAPRAGLVRSEAPLRTAEAGRS